MVGPSNKAHYNKYVPPGGWDYNHDGILDTLALARQLQDAGLITFAIV